MTAASDRLWLLNNGYRLRLSRAKKGLALVETLLRARVDTGDRHFFELLTALNSVGTLLADMYAEHRDWRYRYYYQSPELKRMVADDGDVHRALVHFRRLRARQARALAEALGGLSTVPRPGPALTEVPLGDLWLYTERALGDLAQFMELTGESRTED